MKPRLNERSEVLTTRPFFAVPKKTKGKQVIILGILGSLAAFPVSAQNGDSQEDMRAKIAELEQKLLILERRLELDKEAATEKAKTTPIITAGANGFSLRSADDNFILRIRGYVQADGRFYPDDNNPGTANDKFLIRRARPIFEGTVFEKYDYRLMLDFPSNVGISSANDGLVQDAYVNARFLPGLQLQIGKFKEPVGLERLQSGANLLFVERAYPTLLVPNRDVGAQFQGEFFDGALSYAAGVFNGVANGTSGDNETVDDDKDFAGRIFSHPFRHTGIEALQGFGIGVAGTYGDQEGPLSSYVSVGQQRFFAYRTGTGADAANANVMADGQIWRFTPQGYYYWGPFGLFGEYVIAEQQVRLNAGTDTSFATLRNTAWQVSASYFLTGEKNSFRPVVPRKPFSLSNGGLGAWELALRVQQLDIDDAAFPLYANPNTSASQATSWGVGVNWHLNRNFKLQLDYEQTKFEGGTTQFLKDGEEVIFSRAQISF